MRYRYGAYLTATNEASHTVDKAVTLNEAGQPYAEDVTWTVQGMLHGANAIDVAARFRLMELAFATWGLDLTFEDDNGVVLQALRSNGSLTGVRITKPPSNPVAEGAERGTYISYTFVATCQYPMTRSANALKMFQESLSFTGGGPRRTVVECTNVLPQEQILALYTAYHATQSGRAVGMFAWPPYPAPLFPAALEGTPTIQFEGPKLQNGIFTDFGITWSYSYISALPLAGRPNFWPTG